VTKKHFIKENAVDISGTEESRNSFAQSGSHTLSKNPALGNFSY
jgi:hypothetical protein